MEGELNHSQMVWVQNLVVNGMVNNRLNQTLSLHLYVDVFVFYDDVLKY